MVMKRLCQSLQSTLSDMLRWRRATADWRSWSRVVGDMLRLKVSSQADNRERSIRLRNGRQVHYRLNKGDLWSMREVLLDECYRFPRDIRPEVVVDLGGNIGLTSLWLDGRFALQKLVVVEPLAENARMARKNLSQCTAEVCLVEAAAGRTDGTADFSAVADSNRGSVSFGTPGQTRVVSMPTLFREAGIGPRIDLLKVDIEGGEAELFSGDLEWLAGVQNIIAEFHPAIIDVAPILQNLRSQGFIHVPPGSAFEESMEAFVRDPQHLAQPGQHEVPVSKG